MSQVTALRRQQVPPLGDPLHAQGVSARPACRLRWAAPWLEQRRRQRQQVAASNGGAAQQLGRRPAVSSALPALQFEQSQHPEGGEELLLDVLLPGAAPDAVVRAVFGLHSGGGASAGDAGLLAAFLQQRLGGPGLACEPWQATGSGSGSGSTSSSSSGSSGARRVLTYSTPLSARQRRLLPLGPSAVSNQDEQQVDWQASSSGGGASVHCRCTSTGVPFADCFTNMMHWQVLPLPGSKGGVPAAPNTAVLQPSGSGGGGGTRVRLSARCSFHKRVLGPLRGHIGRESIQGMRDAYAGFGAALQAHFAGGSTLGASSGLSPAAAVSNAARSSCLSSGLEGAVSPLRPRATAVGGAGGAGGTAPSAAAAAAAAAEAEASSRTRGGGSNSWVAAKDMVSELLTADSAEGMLAEASALWPDWSAEGCRLPAPGTVLPVASVSAGAAGGVARAGAPTADEAAAVLHAVAWSANRTPMAERRQLARHRVVRGLVEALRLLAPRTDTGSGSGSGGAQAGQLTCPKAVARALWALAMLGGSVYWEEEAEALCALLPAYPCVNLSQAAMVATALARMRHYTENLILVEQAAVEAVQAHLDEAYAVQAHLQQAADASAAAARAEGSRGGSGGGSGSAARAGSGGGSGGATQATGGGTVPTQSWPSVRKLSDLVWGLASLGHKPLLLLDLLPTVLSGSGGGGDGGGGGRGAARRQFELSCRLGWSLAAAGCLQHPAAIAVAGELAASAARLPSGAASAGHLLQLHQFVLALSLEASPAVQQQRREWGADSEDEGAGSMSAEGGEHGGAAEALRLLHQEPMAAQLLLEAADTWQTEGCRRSSKQVSACQADVASTARTGLGLRVEEEYSVDGISVDIAAPSRGLAIEVDGPTHFCRNSYARPRPVGGTLLKRRLLQGLGWTVVSVDAAEWEELRGTVQKRRALGNAILAAEEANA